MSEQPAAEIASLVNAFFAVFDNRDGRVPDLSELDEMFVPGAQITKRDGSDVQHMSLSEFSKPRKALLCNGELQGFHEWQTDQQTYIGAGIATHCCDYQKEGLQNGGYYTGQGEKHIQLVLTAAGWKITSVLWEDNDE